LGSNFLFLFSLFFFLEVSSIQKKAVVVFYDGYDSEATIFVDNCEITEQIINLMPLPPFEANGNWIEMPKELFLSLGKILESKLNFEHKGKNGTINILNRTLRSL